ncbi:MAG: TonB-dependent receptor [Acidobacteriota bacterium]|nr:TonB-dependent receptor [Acidobacteriota bacterium]
MRLPLTFVLLFTALLVASVVNAQSTSSLHGTVSDPNGAVVPNASVDLSNPETGFSRSTKTDGQGVYQFLQIAPATYQLTVTAPSFGTVKRDNVVLEVSTPATLDIALQVKGSAETVEVTGEAPVVNTSDATIGNTFNANQLISLPSEGRDPVAILSLQPGVAYVGNQSREAQDQDTRGGSVNGARSDQTNVVIDGIDDNDQTRGYAFQGALRATLDSVQEFRVTTSNSNADSGRSSGAQVNLVTKSGTNNFHGSLYEYNRNGLGNANDWFNKKAQLIAGESNRPGKLVRNTFGVSVGGPIKRDRFFFFANYEGQRTAEAVQVLRAVPSQTLRQGMIRYFCNTSDPNCSTSNPLVTSTPKGLVASLGQTQILAMDPVVQQGVNPAVLPILQSYPQPNSDLAANDDLLNLRGFTFAAPTHLKLDTYIVKLDYKLNASGTQSLFARGNLQGDNHAFDPQFPGQPPSQVKRDNSKGMVAGYTAAIGNTKVNSFRYGFIRQGTGRDGLNPTHFVHFRFFDDYQSFNRTELVHVPVHNFNDDFTWSRGKHTLQFGGNYRFVNNFRTSNRVSFSTASTNQFWLNNGGIAQSGSSLDPNAFSSLGIPQIDSGSNFGYDAGIMALTGIIAEVDNQFNLNKQARVIPEGTPLARHFRGNEVEFYGQDTFHITSNLTVTAGLRYSLLQPPYEANGEQVSPSFSLHDFLVQREAHMNAGQPFIPQVSFNLSGQANGRRPYWAWDKKNFAPRFAFAWAPNAHTGIMHAIFGPHASIRGGYGIYYDHFGQSVVNTFDRQGSFGLNSVVTNSASVQGVDCAPRVTSLTAFPSGSFCGQNLSPAPPVGPFPISPPSDLFAITWGLDDKLKTPYSQVVDFSVQRDLGNGFVFEAAYVGRFGRRLLQQKDLAMPLNLVDPASKTDYFTAMTRLVQLAEQGTPISGISPIPYWENLFPAAAGAAGVSGCATGGVANPSATQNIYDLANCRLHNETSTLFVLDGINGGQCFPACSIFGPNTFFHNQYSSLYAWTSSGTSSYNGLQLMLRRHAGPLQFDFNYTFSKSIDEGSNAERLSLFEGDFNNVFSGQIINTWSPHQFRAVSDFDTKHNINANWTYDLPFGKSRRFNIQSTVVDAILGGWSTTGLARWTSGFPISAAGGSGSFPTNWELTGAARITGKIPQTGQFIDSSGNPTIFKNTPALPTVDSNGVLHCSTFCYAYPGQSGVRNDLRGPGYFEIDTGLFKSWRITEQQSLKFGWEVFNVTNSVRFDVGTMNSTFDQQGFGTFTSTLTKPRVMQYSLRYTF